MLTFENIYILYTSAVKIKDKLCVFRPGAATKMMKMAGSLPVFILLGHLALDNRVKTT